MPATPDYGVDAPTVVRTLAITGAVVLATAGAGFVVPALAFLRPFALSGIGLLSSATWMLLGSKVVKIRARDRLVASLDLEGGERVLDVGCGRGLLLIGAATRGARGTGLDLWRQVDQSGNDPAVTRANARAAGAAVALVTADMTSMPFATGTFDIVVSSLAIHNVPGSAKRAQALAEIARVLRPGGRAVLLDIGPGLFYGRTLARAGLSGVRTRPDNLAFVLPTWRVSAVKPPAS